MISTEELLTSSVGFGIATASAAQRAVCRILDGEPLAELASHPDVLELVGGLEALALLPSERGVAPTEAVFLASIRSAKTIIACAAAIRSTQTVDVSRLGPGEVPRVSLVSLKLDTSVVAFRLLEGTIAASPVLKRLLVKDKSTSDTLTIRHPSGRSIEIACVAGSKAGGGLVARWCAGVIFDEAPRMSAAADGVVNLGDSRTAILGRLLPGAQALYIGSPWAPHGDVYDMVEQHWQKPTDHLVVLRGTGPTLNPVWWTPERCRKLEAQDPVAYRTDVLGEFADPESGLLNPLAIERSTRDYPIELPRDRDASYTAAVDPSEGSAGGNGFSCLIVERSKDKVDELPRFKVALFREWRGRNPAECWKEIAACCASYGLNTAVTDQYAASANSDLAKLHGLYLTVDKATGVSKLEDYTNLATLIHNDRVELSPDPILRRDLLSVKRRITQEGTRIVLPRTGDGRHADGASALCAALKHGSAAVASAWPDGPLYTRAPDPRHDDMSRVPFYWNSEDWPDDD
jgi:hypothetical protein